MLAVPQNAQWDGMLQLAVLHSWTLPCCTVWYLQEGQRQKQSLCCSAGSVPAARRTNVDSDGALDRGHGVELQGIRGRVLHLHHKRLERPPAPGLGQTAWGCIGSSAQAVLLTHQALYSAHMCAPAMQAQCCSRLEFAHKGTPARSSSGRACRCWPPQRSACLGLPPARAALLAQAFSAQIPGRTRNLAAQAARPAAGLQIARRPWCYHWQWLQHRPGKEGVGRCSGTARVRHPPCCWKRRVNSSAAHQHLSQHDACFQAELHEACKQSSR